MTSDISDNSNRYRYSDLHVIRSGNRNSNLNRDRDLYLNRYRYVSGNRDLYLNSVRNSNFIRNWNLDFNIVRLRNLNINVLSNRDFASNLTRNIDIHLLDSVQVYRLLDNNFIGFLTKHRVVSFNFNVLVYLVDFGNLNINCCSVRLWDRYLNLTGNRDANLDGNWNTYLDLTRYRNLALNDLLSDFLILRNVFNNFL